MTDVTVTVDGTADTPNEENELDETEAEGQGLENPDEAQEEHKPEVDHAEALRHAKLAHLVEAYLPEGTDIEAELAHVGGLEVGEDGTITGTPVYRKPTVATKSNKASTAKANPRKTAPSQPESWDVRRDRIREQKRAAGIIYS